MRNEGLFTGAVEQDLGRKPALTWISRLGGRGRRRFLKVIDLTALTLSLPLGWTLAGGGAAILPALPWGLPILVVVGALWLLLADSFDLYSPKMIHHPAAGAWRAFLITIAVAALALMPVVLFADLPWPAIALAAAGLAFLLVPLSRALVTSVLASLPPRRVLLAARRAEARSVGELLSKENSAGTEVIGYLDGGSPLGSGAGVQVPYLGSISQLDQALALHRPHVLAVGVGWLESFGREKRLPSVLAHGARVITLPEFCAEISGRLPASLLGEVELAKLLRRRRNEGRALQFARRALDILCALVGLVALALVGPFIALAIYLEDGGPIFFRQARVGQGGAPFQIYKFRSMRPQPQADAAEPMAREDRRITRVGRLLRETHLDELPQFINILKGEMSMVGPRPERLVSAQRFRGQIPHYDARHRVRPGLTGWALVNMGYAASDDARLKHEYDLYYVARRSLWLDWVTLLKTVAYTLTLRGK